MRIADPMSLPFLRTFRRPAFRLVAAAVMLASALGAYVLNATASLAYYFTHADFSTFLVADHRFWSDLPTYVVPATMPTGGRFVTGAISMPYPPTFFLLLQPWVLLPDGAAQLAWLGLQQVALVAVILVAYAGIGRPSPAEGCVAVALVLLSLPVRDTIFEGQMGLILGALCAGAMLAHRRGHGAVGGALLALAIALKLTPVLLLGYFLLRRAWRLTAFTLAWLGLLLAVSVWLAGTARWSSYLQLMELLQRGTAFVGNQSIPGVVLRAVQPGLDAQPIPLPALAPRIIALLLELALAAAVAWRVRRTPATELGAWTQFSLVLLALPLVQPFAWFHHWAIAVPAILVATRLAVTRALHVSALVLFGLAYAASVAAYPLYRLVRSVPGSALRGRPLLFGASVVFLVAVSLAIAGFAREPAAIAAAGGRFTD
ncbi:MAG: glycosyltransferase family 87 protein [Candidatus Dormibacteria bacterium]